MRLRGLSELYGALVMLAASAAVAAVLVPWLEAQAPRPEPPRPVKVLEVNETHALCLTTGPWDTGYWLRVGNFTYWVYVNDTDGDGLLDPTPGEPGATVPPGTYVLVTPPWPCR